MKVIPKLKVGVLALSLSSVGMFSSLSFASEEGGLFVEPGVTYQTQKSSIDNPPPFSDSDAEVKGFGLMARLGFHINEAFFVGADGRYSMPNYKDSAVNYDTSAVAYDLGPTVGFQMPDVGLRVWGTYILRAELDPKGTSNLDYKFTEGKGYRIGAGFRVKMVSLNLEYQKVKYDNTNFEKASIFSGANTDSIKYDGSAWIASVSFPMEL